jgi:hypothetical protein
MKVSHIKKGYILFGANLFLMAERKEFAGGLGIGMP